MARCPTIAICAVQEIFHASTKIGKVSDFPGSSLCACVGNPLCVQMAREPDTCIELTWEHICARAREGRDFLPRRELRKCWFEKEKKTKFLRERWGGGRAVIACLLMWGSTLTCMFWCKVDCKVYLKSNFFFLGELGLFKVFARFVFFFVPLRRFFFAFCL